MASSTQKIKCSKCQTEQIIKTYDSINTKDSPNLKEMLLNKKLFSFTCSGCREEIPVEYNCLYHDPDKKLFIYLIPGFSNELASQLDELGEQILSRDPNYTLRVVKNINDLTEKIKIFDAGKNDMVIELCKIPFMIDVSSSRSGFTIRHIFFDSIKGSDAFVMFDNNGKMIKEDLNEELYKSIILTYAQKLSEPGDHSYRLIDRSWALSII